MADCVDINAYLDEVIPGFRKPLPQSTPSNDDVSILDAYFFDDVSSAPLSPMSHSSSDEKKVNKMTTIKKQIAHNSTQTEYDVLKTEASDCNSNHVQMAYDEIDELCAYVTALNELKDAQSEEIENLRRQLKDQTEESQNMALELKNIKSEVKQKDDQNKCRQLKVVKLQNAVFTTSQQFDKLNEAFNQQLKQKDEEISELKKQMQMIKNRSSFERRNF